MIIMRPEDLPALHEPYAHPEDGYVDGRFAHALHVDLPATQALEDEIYRDLDEKVYGIGWWVPHPGTKRRILISDHLFQCASSILTNLVEARLHLLELEHWWSEEQGRLAKGVRWKCHGHLGPPPITSPLDELPDAMANLHTAGFARAIGSALDCLGACIVGVLALPGSILKADLGSARKLLAGLQVSAPGSRLQTSFRSKLDAAIEVTGPAGWHDWITDLRNLYVHRGRRIQRVGIKAKHRLLDAFGRPIPSVEATFVLPRDPRRSEIEVFRDPGRTPVLTESAGTTLNGLLRSAIALVEATSGALFECWSARRVDPSMLPQPRQQWPDAALPPPGSFAGYAPGSEPFRPGGHVMNIQFKRRFLAACLANGMRDRWRDFD